MSTPFHLLSSLIKVRDLAGPVFATFDEATPAAEAWHSWSEQCGERGLDPMSQLSLTSKAGVVAGWVGFDMLVDDRTVGECAELVVPDAILAADTPVIEAAKAFASTTQPFFLVLEKHSLTGWISYTDLYKLPFRLCLFSVLLAIETLASDLMNTKPKAALNAMKPSRMGTLKEVYRKRGFRLAENGEEYDVLLLDCTTFIDKVQILRKAFIDAVPAAADRLFDAAEAIRNDLAHPRDEGDISEKLKRDRLLPFLEWSERIQMQISQVLRKG